MHGTFRARAAWSVRSLRQHETAIISALRQDSSKKLAQEEDVDRVMICVQFDFHASDTPIGVALSAILRALSSFGASHDLNPLAIL